MAAAHDAAGVLSGGDGHSAVAVLDLTAGQIAHDTADELTGGGNGTGNAQVPDRTANIAEQTLLVVGVVDIQVLDHVALTVEHALIHDVSGGGVRGVVADGRPGVVLQIDVGGQNGVQRVLAIADGLGEPCQLGGSADLVSAVGVLLRLGGGRAVPFLHGAEVGQHLSVEGVLVGLDGGFHLGSGLGSALTGDAVLGAFLGNGVLQIEAVAHVVRGVRAGGQAAHIGGGSARTSDGGDAVAVGQRRAIRLLEVSAADTAHIALVFGSGGDLTAGIAVGDGRARSSIARDAAAILLGVDIDGAVAVLDAGVRFQIARDTACLRVAAGGAGHIAGHAQIRHLSASLYIAEDTHGIAAAVDVQILHHVASAIESAIEVLHGRPVETGQINIGSQLGAGAAAVGGEPCQLSGRADLVHAVVILGRLGLGLAVPGVFTGLGQNSGLDGQDAVLHIGGVSAAQREAAHGADIAVLHQRVGIGAIAQNIHTVRVGRDRRLAIAAQQGDGHAVHGLAVFIGDVQLDGIGLFLVNRDHSVSVVAQVVRDGNGVEVGAHAGIGHGVQEREGVGGGVHAAEGVTVGKGVLRGSRAVSEGHILRNGDSDGRGIHSLILAGRTLKLGVTGVIGGLEGGGVEDAGDLVDRAVHTLESQLHLIAGHDILAGVGDILAGDRDLGHAHQTVADTGIIGHPDDNRTAHAVAGLIEGGQRYSVVAVSIGGNAGKVGGDLGGHAVVSGDKSVVHIDIAGSRDGEVQRGVRLFRFIEPGVVVIIPVQRAGGGGAGSHVELHFGVGSAVGHASAAHHHDAHALRVGGGEHAAMGANAVGVSADVQRSDINAVIVNGDDGVISAGGDVRPVSGGVAAVDRLVIRIAPQDIPVEVRLHHDVASVGVDELPVTIGTDTGRIGDGLEAGGIQVDLQVGLVTACDRTAQLAEIVRETVSGRAVKVQRDTAVVNIGQPAGTGHMVVVAETPGVVAVALGDSVGGFLGLAVPADRPAVGIGDILFAVGRDFRGVEVVPLEVQAEGGVSRNRDRQVCRDVEGHQLGTRIGAGAEGLVDVLVEDVAINIGIGVGIVQAGVASRVQHGGIIGIIAADIGVAHGGAAAHDGAVHTDMELVSGEIGIVCLFGGDIERVALQIDRTAAACAAVHVLVGGQVQGHAAQRYVILFRIGVPAKSAVGIASGLQLGVEHLVVADQLALRNIILLLALGGSVGEVAVQEHVLDLVAQHFVAVAVLVHIVQLDDGIALGGVIVVVSAHIEAELQRGGVLHGQGQRPGVLGEVHTVVGGIEAVHIRTGRQLRDLNGGHAEEGIGEIGHGSPGVAAVGGALIVVVLVGQSRLALSSLEDLASLQIVQQIGRAGLHGVAGRGGIAGLEGGNGHVVGRGLVAVVLVALLRLRLVLVLVAAVVGVVAVIGVVALVGIVAVIGGGGVLVGVSGIVFSVVGDDLRGLRFVIGERRHGQVAHQGQHHGQRQQKRKQSFSCFHVLLPFV